MNKILGKIAPPLVGSGLFHVVTGRPITWITVLGVILGTLTYLFLAPLVTVIYKNIRHEEYID